MFLRILTIVMVVTPCIQNSKHRKITVSKISFRFCNTKFYEPSKESCLNVCFYNSNLSAQARVPPPLLCSWWFVAAAVVPKNAIHRL